MNFCIGVIIDPQADDVATRDLVESWLSSYSRELKVPPYHKYLTQEETDMMAKEYGTTDLKQLATHMQEWVGSEGGLDGEGLYTITEDNPTGILDTWELYGPNPVRDKLFNAENEIYCQAMITGDGKIHQGPVVYLETEENQAKLDAWDAEVHGILEASKDKLAFVAYCTA